MTTHIPAAAWTGATGWLLFCLAPESVRAWAMKPIDWLTAWPDRLRWLASLLPRKPHN